MDSRMEFKTIHEMYQHWFDTRSNLAAYHLKRGDRWEAVTWHDFEAKMTHFALGLMAMGMEYRDPVTILGLTREEWDIADKATLSAGGVSVGCYHSSTPPQVRYVVHHSESRFLVVEDKQQWEKVEQIRKDLPKVRRVIVMEPEGIEGQDFVSFQEVTELGRQERGKYEQEYRRRFSSVTSEDAAILFYTSGTTGPPKGAMLTHRNILEACRSMRDLNIFSAQDVTVIWLPMPHIYGRIAQIAGTLTSTQGYYAESLDRIVENMKEIRPTIFYSVPRIFEKVYTRVVGEVEEASVIKKRIFRWSLDTGLVRSRLLQEGRDLPFLLRLKYRLADALVFNKVRDAFGGRIRIIISGGAPISKEILRFFHAAGILPLEMYGITEALLCTMNRPDAYRFGSMGVAAPGVRIRIAEDGEITVSSDMIFKGYLKDEEKTREAFPEEGWFATGDVGVMDQDGFVWITDRKKDILITAGGKNVAPQNIENLLKTSPYISQVMVYGDGKPYLTALVTLDPEEIGKWASSNGLDPKDSETLCEHPRVVELVESVILERSGDLASYEQVKAFRIIPKEFSQETGTLTATMKVRRREVIKRYGELLESLYDASPNSTP
jgi:long-chain acyl-CoA synthetase